MIRPQPGTLCHTCIRVKDIDASVAFYHGLLGMPIVERRDPPPPGVRMAALGLQQDYLEIFQNRPDAAVDSADPQSLRLNHICLWAEDLAGLEGRAAAAGHPFTQPIRSNPGWVGAAINVSWIVDPDGNRVELLEWTGPAA